MNVTRDPLPLVAKANPVPDLAQLDADEVAEALATIERRWAAETGAARPGAVRQGGLRPAVVVLVAAVIVILAIATPLWLMRSAEPGPVVEPTSTIVPTTALPAPTTLPQVSVTTTTPVTTTLPQAIPLQWQVLPTDPSLDGRIVLDVAVGGPGLVAGGILDGPAFEAAVWVSSDGLNWSRAGDPSEFAPLTAEGDTRILDIAAGQDAIVAVGLDGFDAAVWRSVDGLSWERIMSESLGGDDVQQMDEVVANGAGFFAVGRDGADGAVWGSTDGTAWERVPEAITTEGAGRVITYSASPLGIAEGSGAGRFGLTGGSNALVVWLADDGRTWVDPGGPVDPETGLGPYGIIGWAEGFLAYGPPGRLWTSVDGLNWDRNETPVFASEFGTPHLPQAAVTSSGAVVVVGSTIGGESAVWTSADNGTTWGRSTLPTFEGEAVTGGLVDVVEYGSQLMVFGGTADSSQQTLVLVGSWND